MTVFLSVGLCGIRSRGRTIKSRGGSRSAQDPGLAEDVAEHDPSVLVEVDATAEGVEPGVTQDPVSTTPEERRFAVGLPRISILQVKGYRGTGGCVGSGQTTRSQVTLSIASFKTSAQQFD